METNIEIQQQEEQPLVPDLLVEADRVKAEVVSWDKEVIEGLTSISKGSMRAGWFGHKIQAAKKFGLLGFNTEDEYWEERGFRRSTWYRNTKIASCFQKLDLDAFLGMTLKNAELLVDQVPEEERQKTYWVKFAQTLKHEKLLEKVNAKYPVQQSDDEEEVIETAEDKFGYIKIPCIKARQQAVLDGLEQFKNKHSLNTIGQALEMLITEYTDRVTFVGFISDQLPILQFALKKEGSVEDVADALRMALQSHVIGLAEILANKTGKEPVAAS
jgi:hypothetical protein